MQPQLPKIPLILSFFQLSDYINCPRKFYHRHIAKDTPKEEKSTKQTAGIEVHDALKRRIKLREPLPLDMSQYESTCKSVADDTERKTDVELALGCTADGGPCSFFDPNCVLRGRLDLCMVHENRAAIVDWKTGKPWEDPLELQIQGLLLKIHRPELKELRAFYWWLRENRYGTIYVIDPQIVWNNVQAKMMGIKYRLDNNDWPPDENPLCPWCPVSKEQCEFKKDPRA